MADELIERLRYELHCLTPHERQHTAISDAADALEAQQARIADLEAERAKAREAIQTQNDVIVSCATRIRALEEALKPFAKEAEAWAEYEDCEPLVESFPDYYGSIKVCDLRRAKQVMEGEE